MEDSISCKIAHEQERWLPPYKLINIFHKATKLIFFGAIIVILLFSFLTVLLELTQIPRDQRIASNKDFVSYWAAATLLREHKNPYDTQSVQAIEKSFGYRPKRGVTMRNPPLALPLVFPFGFLDLRWAAFLWSIAIIGIVGLTGQFVRMIHGFPNNHYHLLSFVFPAAVSCFEAGQTSAFVLIGIVCFLYFERKNPFVAGLSITVCSVKPHLIVPFGAVLILWATSNKIWSLIAGVASGLGVLCALSLFLGSALWQEYFVLLGADGLDREFHPVIGSVLRVAVDRNADWIQYLPMVVGTAWGLWYFLQSREHWDWRRQGSLLLIISLLGAPYAWFFDEIILLPAMLHAIYTSKNQSRAALGFSLLSCAALAEIMLGAPVFSILYMWTTPVWFAWYLIETRGQRFDRPTLGLNPYRTLAM
jgi:hypothetical protein